MSFFEAKEWWSTTISNNEEFDSNSICIDNIDNDHPPKNKIIISSFSGFLRIYEPHFGPYKSEDLLLEKFFDNPILQISSGNFIINSPDKQLAILQNKKLIVLQINNLKGLTQTKICYEHKLNRNGFNFTLGKIGDRNYDVIFVQSLDGVISIYEQDSLVNMIALSEVLFPGPINFLTRKECFLIANTNYEIECYSYNNLATSNTRSTGESSDSSKKISHTWSTELGELIREMKIIDNRISKKQEIFCLTESAIFLLDDNGKLLYQKKLDFEPLSLFVYNIDPNIANYAQNKSINLMYMISSIFEHIFVYRGLEMVWAMKVPETPVYLALADFDVNKNLIISLNDEGKLGVMYLGMEEFKSNKIISSTRNMDMNFIASETERLGEMVQNYENGVQVLSNFCLMINADVYSKVSYDNDTLNEMVFHTDNNGKIARSQVCLTFSFDGFEAENIKVNVICPNNIICDHPNFQINSLKGKDGDKKIYVNFRVLNLFYPSFTNVKVHATYSIKGEKNSLRRFFFLFFYFFFFLLILIFISRL